MEDNRLLKLNLPLPTSVNHIYGRNRFGSTYLKKEGKDYKKINGEYIKEEVKKQGWTKLVEGEYCYLDEVVYMNVKGRDSDNLKKLTQDTITECQAVWFDDTYCLPRTNRVYIDSNNPRLEIIIKPVGNVGIFDNNEDYIDFKSKCDECSKYKEGKCSTYKKALESRIQDEIVLVDNKWTCSKFKISKKTK